MERVTQLWRGISTDNPAAASRKINIMQPVLSTARLPRGKVNSFGFIRIEPNMKFLKLNLLTINAFCA